MAVGNTLRERRKQQSLTASQAAAGTRLKLQVIEALENEDYDRIPAPIYVKGFMKIYAEYLGLDPQPLIDEYESGPPVGTAKEPEPVTEAREVPRPGRMHRSTSGEEMDFFKKQQKEAQEKPSPVRTPVLPRLPELKLRQFSDWIITVRQKLRKSTCQLIDQIESELIHVHNTVKLRLKPLLTAAGPYGQKALAVAGLLLLAVLLFSTAIRCTRGGSGRSIMLSDNGAPLNLAIDPPEPYLDEPINP